MLDYPPDSAVIRVNVLGTQWWLHRHVMSDGVGLTIVSPPLMGNTPLPQYLLRRRPAQ